MSNDATQRKTPVASLRRVRSLTFERRYDRYGGMRLMAEAEGYVMMRRVGRMPGLITRKEWDELSRVPLDGPKLRVVQNAT